jgi:hypothetical protein
MSTRFRSSLCNLCVLCVSAVNMVRLFHHRVSLHVFDGQITKYNSPGRILLCVLCVSVVIERATNILT